MAEKGGMLKGALIGGAIGAVAALLLAPKPGRELRSDIRNRYTDVQDRTRQMLNDAGEKTQMLARQVGDQASHIIDKTKSAVTAAKEEAMSWKEEKEDEMKDAVSKIN